MRELGYLEGKNFIFEFRISEGKTERLPGLAAELARAKCDVIVAAGPEAVIRAAQQAAGVIPVVMVAIDFDPVATGYIKSLRRPGVNTTGLHLQQIELTAKRMELLKELFPKARRIAVLSETTTTDQLAAARRAAQTLGIAVQPMELRDPPYNYAAIFETMKKGKPDAVLVMQAGVFFRDRTELANQSLKHKLPGAYGQSEFAEAGGLFSYGANISDIFLRVADYVDRILKGSAVAVMPVEQPTKFEVVINLKTAKALGIKVPQTILLRADRVIE